MLVLTILIPLLFAVIVLVRPPAAAKYWALGGTIGVLPAGRDDRGAVLRCRGNGPRGPAGRRLARVAPRLRPEPLDRGRRDRGAAHRPRLAARAHLRARVVDAIPERRARLFYGWLMVLQAAMVGVFAARDLLFFYICFEFTLLPMFVLINEFGSTNRKAAATKFFLYTFTGSLIALAGLVYVAWRRDAGERGKLHLDIGCADERGSSVLMTDRGAGACDVRDARRASRSRCRCSRAHVAAPGAHRGADGGLGHAGGRAAQARHLRDLPLRAAVHARRGVRVRAVYRACSRSSASSTPG
jgi:hypothetical protein